MRFTGKISLAANTPRTVKQLIETAINGYAFLSAAQKAQVINQFSRHIACVGNIRNRSANIVYAMQDMLPRDAAGNPTLTQANLAAAGFPIIQEAAAAPAPFDLSGMDAQALVLSCSVATDLFIDVLFA
jgi:hypothetical protein